MAASATPELCVIGAGAAGLSVAIGAAALGVPVTLIEKDEIGGQRLDRGSLPSKALIAAGRAGFMMRTAERFGIRAQEPWVDYAQTRAHLRSVIEAVAPNYSIARLHAMNIKVIRGAARFTSKTTIEVNSGAIEARRFVVATGSSPAVPPIPGLEQIRALTLDSIFDLETLPTRLIVLGAAREGLELAQAFRRLGCEVTILAPGRALADEDFELADVLLAQLSREGIVLREQAEIVRGEPRGAGLRLVLAGKLIEETVDGSHLLVAGGRMPNVEGLGFEAAGVAFDKSGIKLNRKLRSSNPRVYAVGDVTGAPFSAAAAHRQAALFLRTAIAGRPDRSEFWPAPQVTFTDPEIAVAGLREAEARRRYGGVHVLRWPFAENDRARAEHASRGHLKVILSRRETILGVGIVGPLASELIVPWQLAISNALRIEDMADLVLAYPTLSEISQRAAATAQASHLRKPWTNPFMRLMRAFG